MYHAASSSDPSSDVYVVSVGVACAVSSNGVFLGSSVFNVVCSSESGVSYLLHADYYLVFFMLLRLLLPEMPLKCLTLFFSLAALVVVCV